MCYAQVLAAYGAYSQLQQRRKHQQKGETEHSLWVMTVPPHTHVSIELNLHRIDGVV